jgi:hypothetical protein
VIKLSSENVWILVPIFALLIGGLAILLKYKKDMAMIARGLHPHAHKKNDKHDDLTSGLIMLGIGIALYVGFLYGLGGFGAYMVAPLILIFVGIALILSYWAKTGKKRLVVPRVIKKRITKKKPVKKVVRKKRVTRKRKKR